MTKGEGFEMTERYIDTQVLAGESRILLKANLTMAGSRNI